MAVERFITESGSLSLEQMGSQTSPVRVYFVVALDESPQISCEVQFAEESGLGNVESLVCPYVSSIEGEHFYSCTYKPLLYLYLTGDENNQDSDLCIENNTTVTDANGKLILNGETVHGRFALNVGEYNLVVAEAHPIRLIDNDTSKIRITGQFTHTNGSSNVGYHGNVVISVYEDFGTISYECTKHGAMGGTDNLIFNTKCKLGEPIIPTPTPSPSATPSPSVTLDSGPQGPSGEGYTFSTKADLQTAVDAWDANSTSAEAEYGNINNWNVSAIEDMSYLFKDKTNITSLDLSNWDTRNVTNMDKTFSYFTSLTSLDVSTWDTSNVTNMLEMFRYCRSLTSLDVSDWDTSSVTNMGYMFVNCIVLSDIDMSSWCVSGFESADYTHWDGTYYWNNTNFTEHTSISSENLPVWGYCPVVGTITGTTAIGDDTLNVSNSAEFTIGDQLVIDRGTSSEETTTIIDKGSLVIYPALTKSHADNATVESRPAVPSPTPSPTESPTYVETYIDGPSPTPSPTESPTYVETYIDGPSPTPSPTESPTYVETYIDGPSGPGGDNETGSNWFSVDLEYLESDYTDVEINNFRSTHGWDQGGSFRTRFNLLNINIDVTKATLPNQYYDPSFWSSMNYPSSLLCGYIVKSSDTRTFDEIHTSAWQNAVTGSWNSSGDRYNVPNVYGNNCLDLTGGIMTFDHQYALFDGGDGNSYNLNFYDTVATDLYIPTSGIIQKYALNDTILDHPFTNSSLSSFYRSFEYGPFGYEKPSQSISEYANGEELKILLGFQIEGWDSNWNYIHPHTNDGMIWGIGEFPFSYRKIEASDSYLVPSPTPSPSVTPSPTITTSPSPSPSATETPTPIPFNMETVDFTDPDLIFYVSVSNIQGTYSNNGKTTVGNFKLNDNASSSSQSQKSGIILGDSTFSHWPHNYIIQVDLIHPTTSVIKTWASSYDSTVTEVPQTLLGLSQSYNTPGFIFFGTTTNANQFDGYILHDIKIEESHKTSSSYPGAEFTLNLYSHSSSSNQYNGVKLGSLLYTTSTCGTSTSPGGGYWWSVTSRSWDAN